MLWECEAYGELREEFMMVLESEARRFEEEKWLTDFKEASIDDRTRAVLGGEPVGERVEDVQTVRAVIDNLSLQFIVKVHERRVQQIYNHPVITYSGAISAIRPASNVSVSAN